MQSVTQDSDPSDETLASASEAPGAYADHDEEDEVAQAIALSMQDAPREAENRNEERKGDKPTGLRAQRLAALE